MQHPLTTDSARALAAPLWSSGGSPACAPPPRQELGLYKGLREDGKEETPAGVILSLTLSKWAIFWAMLFLLFLRVDRVFDFEIKYFPSPAH